MKLNLKKDNLTDNATDNISSAQATSTSLPSYTPFEGTTPKSTQYVGEPPRNLSELTLSFGLKISANYDSYHTDISGTIKINKDQDIQEQVDELSIYLKKELAEKVSNFVATNVKGK